MYNPQEKRKKKTTELQWEREGESDGVMQGMREREKKEHVRGEEGRERLSKGGSKRREKSEETQKEREQRDREMGEQGREKMRDARR